MSAQSVSSHNFIKSMQKASPISVSKDYQDLKPKVKILHGVYSEASRKFGISSRSKQSPATCLVAVVYHQVHPVWNWTKQDVHRILDIGDKLYRTSVNHTPLKSGQVLKPHCVHPIIYIDRYKYTIFVGNDVITAVHTPQHPALRDILVRADIHLDDKHDGLILNFNDKNFSIWKDQRKFYLFRPHDGDNDGFPIKSGTGKCFVIRTDDIGELAEHLGFLIHGRFSIYSMKILKFIELKSTMSGLIAQIKESEMPRKNINVEHETVKNVMEPKMKIPPGYTKDLEYTERQLSLMNNSKFKKQNDYQGSLLHNAYEQDVDMVLFDNLAALIMLHRKKASTWDSRTIVDILALGNDISDNEIDIDTHIAGYFNAEAYEKSYKVEFEKAVFGQVTSREDNVATVETATPLFFKNFEMGLIDGPQIVAIWREKNLYYSFDPKERDALGRKWTRLLAKEVSSTKKGGGACVLYHTDIKHLTNTYISNIPVKHRKDPFRIVHVKVTEKPRDDDWEEWKLAKTGMWFLQGEHSLCKYLMHEDENKFGKSLSVAVYALAFLYEFPEDEWSDETLDNVLKSGIEFYSSMESTANKLADISKTVAVDGKKIIVRVDECVVSQNDVPDLTGLAAMKKGLEMFFHDYRAGILTCGENVLVIWHSGSAYYVLDFSDKHNICQSLEIAASIPGKTTAFRSAKLVDMVKVIASNPKYLACADFCISMVETSFEEGRDVPLRNYTPLLDSSAILLQDGYHEGHSMFDTRADNQTPMNLLTALCLSTINTAAEWSKVDLVDILRIGDRMYQHFIENIGECEGQRREMTFGDIRPKIGVTTFTFETTESEGILAKVTQTHPEQAPEDTNDNIREISSNASRQSNRNISNEYIEPEQPNGEQEIDLMSEPETAATLLRKIGSNRQNFTATLKNDFFSTAIWKQGDLYFVFDPKANDEKGYPSPRRIQQGVALFEARKKAGEEEAAKSGQQRDTVNVSNPSLDNVNANSRISNQHIVEVPAESPIREVGNNGTDNPVPDIMSTPNDGSAYVAWFQSLDGLIDHLISKVPAEYHNTPIKFNTITITKNVPLLNQGSLNNYEERDTDGFWILRGFLSQDDSLLPHRNNLDGACSIIALAFTLISPADEWQHLILDVILKYGDRLYSKSLMLQKALDAPVKLDVEQISKSFSIYKHKFEYEIKPTPDQFSLNNPRKFDEINTQFVEYLLKLGSNKEIVGFILNLNDGYHVALWKTDSIIYVYDCHPNDPDSAYRDNGPASLSRFSNMDVLFQVLRRKFNNTREAITVEVIEVEMQITKSKLAKPPKNTINNFIVPLAQSAFTHHEKDDTQILKIQEKERHASDFALNVAAVLMSHLFHPECWTTTTMNKIFDLAEKLHESSTGSMDDLTLDKIEMEMRNLVKCFTVDDTICRLNINEIIRGPIRSKSPTDVSLENSLTLFLRNFCRAVVITASFVCAIWREGDVYYLFSAPEGDMTFVLSSKCQDKMLDWMRENAPKDELSDWYQIVRVEITSIQTRDLTKSSSAKSRQSRKIVKSKSKVQTEAATRKILNGKDFDELEKASCLVAAGLCFLKDIGTWRSSDLKTISRSGLLLYMDSIAVHGHRAIEIDNMEKLFQLERIQLQVEATPVPMRQEVTLENIVKTLADSLTEHKMAYILSGLHCMLAINWNGNFYAFHPETLSPSGQYRRACVRQLASFEELCKHFIQRIRDEPEDKISSGTISVHLAK